MISCDSFNLTIYCVMYVLYISNILILCNISYVPLLKLIYFHVEVEYNIITSEMGDIE